MFEHHKHPLLTSRQFILRQFIFLLVAIGIIIGSLVMGMLGYHFFENLSWIDALVNAAMILGGMGPVNALHTDAGKLFASFYALFAGMVFLSVAGILVVPIAHRLL